LNLISEGKVFSAKQRGAVQFFLFINRLPAVDCFKGLAVHPDRSQVYTCSFPESFMERPKQGISESRWYYFAECLL